jgi:hypothetical protein
MVRKKDKEQRLGLFIEEAGKLSLNTLVNLRMVTMMDKEQRPTNRLIKKMSLNTSLNTLVNGKMVKKQDKEH